MTVFFITTTKYPCHLKNNKFFKSYNSFNFKLMKKNNKAFILNGSREKNIDKKEIVFFEGPPSPSELIIPFISILTVIGIIPFITTVFRQFWVKYTITTRRISVDSGFNGKNHIEIVYRDIKKITYISRFGGICADVVIVLKDGARLELRSLSEWEKNVKFIKSKCNDDIMV